MAEEKIPKIMRDFVGAMAKGDVEKALSFLSKDAVWVNPNGTLKGKEEIKRYLTWMAQTMPDSKITETGNGIIAQGNKAFYEHVLSGTMNGMKYEGLAMCAYEFKDDKIKGLRTTYDRLSMAQQVVKGGLGKWMVNTVAKQAEKGLR